ncbi:Transglycosylase SLT domain-containing protein [Algoriphagus ornithinivorans]|uniref:Transglycosylase SLT domain-containing protein n=1 Tax=Algoriphagus ornithinivorans TaxID=226506 RepID=A0A1I5FTY4_9BACT|nr:lytic transglycosylase domain-containing protein [Algoriphagus ornithinivorans]SFO27089.1 Transglycosylase SLT domain-containing protein [Algoriphagus ornithinivorans]
MKSYHLFIIYGLLFTCLIGLAVIWKSSDGSVLQETEETLIPMSLPTLPADSVRIFEIPKELSFAGEKVPLEIQDVYERLEREIYVNAYWQSNMVLLMKRSGKYLNEISQILQENGIPDDFKYLAIAESALMNATSSAGAKGFWQFMEDTAKEYDLEISRDVDERYHWQKSTVAAAKYLNKAHQKFGNWTAVAASYNMGQSGLSRRQTEQLQEDYYDLLLNDETSRYIFRILAFKVIFENPKKYGFGLRKEDYYTNPVLKSITVSDDIKNLAEWAKQRGSSYKELKLYNPWLRDRDLNVKRGRSYEILLPE